MNLNSKLYYKMNYLYIFHKLYNFNSHLYENFLITFDGRLIRRLSDEIDDFLYEY